MKKNILLILLLTVSVFSFAQNRRVSGTLIDKDTKEGVMQVTVQLLKTDSSFVSGAISDEAGKFSLTAPRNGNYILKFTSVGYKQLVKDVSITGDKNVSLGNITFSSDAIMLKGATVTGQASKVTVRKDTFVYSADAYRTPEGSVIEELVKKLPGAEVDDDGKITINGKEVKKILVDGKEFMTGDTKTAMQNLPTYIINNIKAYDQRSDLSRITGIDDGEEETVLDFGIKPGMNKGMFSNIDVAVGNKSRYAERLMLAVFKSNWKLMGFANSNNTGDRGFPGGGGGGQWGRANGLNTSKMMGLNFNYDDSKKLAMDISLRWNHRNGDVLSKQSVENFVSKAGSFSNSISQNYTRSDSWNFRMRMEWKPDTMTNIMFRPSVSTSKNDGNNTSRSATFMEDPYLYVGDPLSDASIEELAADSLMVNRRTNGSLSYSDDISTNAVLQINRKLNNNGRNVTLRGQFRYGDSESKSISTSDVILYQIRTAAGNDSTYYTNRYNLTPTKNWSYSWEATYSEPIFKRTYLQFRYRGTYNYNKSDRSTYDFSLFPTNIFSGVPQVYRGWNNYLSLLTNPLDYYLDDDLSRFSEYKNMIHEGHVIFRLIRDKYRMNAGVMLQAQNNKFVQDYQGIHTDTTRHVVNFTPTLDLRYNPNDVTELRINYRGETQQPSMSNLLDITDDSDPLNITKGNPGLKPSFTNRFELYYNTYIQSHQRGIMTFANYNNTSNSISNMVTYDERTGGRTTRPENINGNWNANLGFMFNTAIDSAGVWNINTFTMGSYNNYVGYLYVDALKAAQKNTTRTTFVRERLQGSFRKDWIEVTVDGSLNYTHTRNLLQSQSNLDTWQFSYGGGINLYAPWGGSLTSDIHNQSRRGYNDASMNTNELIWNAQLSQTFLKGKPLTVSLQFYDILHQMSNYRRSINAMQRSDTEYNNINSYAMLHVIYRLNIFGGKEAREQMQNQGPGGDRRGGFGGNRGGWGGRGGGRGGWGGGGRPGGFGGR
ncbi:MAG: outer membrane beta-barrel protein [Prevotella sp.]|nr:outer membrane beta-barrel protein [Prevotella sp.]